VRPTLHNLQALRGVACLLVLGVHLAVWEGSFGIGRPLLHPFMWFGYAGVDLFFVLSGFIITHTQGKYLGQPTAVPGYLFRRAWRIYPTFLVVMPLAVIGVLALTGHWAYPTTPDAPGVRTRWISWLTLAPCRVANLYVPPAWSLSYELLFYLAFALLLVLPKRIGPWLLVAWGVGIGVLAAFGGPLAFTRNAWVEHLGSPFVWEFLAGCGIAWMVGRGWSRFGWLSLALGLAWATAWVLTLADPANPPGVAANLSRRVFVFGVASALLVYGTVAVEIRGGRTLPRWLQRTGDASYSIYLWHAPAGAVAFHLTFSWPHTFVPHLGWLTMMLVVCLGGGFGLYRLVERPLLKVWKRKRPVPTPPVVLAERVGRPRTVSQSSDFDPNGVVPSAQG
jgi:exopolysaccharide production protein ExoZ